MRCLDLAAVVLAAFTAVHAAHAQTDMSAMAHRTAANQLGVLEFCQGRGDVGTDAVSAGKGALGRLSPADVSTDADEAAGKSGSIVAPNGHATTLASIASQHGTTVSALCKQLGRSALRSTSMGSVAGTMSMPSLPGGLKMPSFGSGGGMAMPSVPGSPSGSGAGSR